MEWLFDLVEVSDYRETMWAWGKVFESSSDGAEQELQSDHKNNHRDDEGIMEGGHGFQYRKTLVSLDV